MLVRTVAYFYFFLIPALTICHTLSHATVHPVPMSDITIGVYKRLVPYLSGELDNRGLKLGSPVFIRIFKESSELELWLKKENSFVLFQTYRVCDYSGFLGPKLQEGDKQSPEGFYTIGIEQFNPWSNFHLSLNLGFPNEYDRMHNRNGSALMIHGRCSSAGCYAMTDSRMDEIYTIAAHAIGSGQQFIPVHIFPFSMTWKNLARHNRSEWLHFWENLKEGYDFFLDHGVPPYVGVKEKRYVFSTTPATNPVASKKTIEEVKKATLIRRKRREFFKKKKVNKLVKRYPYPLSSSRKKSTSGQSQVKIDQRPAHEWQDQNFK